MVDPLERPDTLGVRAAALTVPERLAAAADAARSADLPTLAAPPTAVVLVGAGSGRLVAEAVAAVVGPEFPVPMVVSSDGVVPSFIDDGALVLAISYHGDTDEVLTVARALPASVLVTVTAGGLLADVPADRTVRLVADVPVARAALAPLASAVLVVLERLGLVAPVGEAVAAATDQLRRRRELLQDPAGPGPTAATLARRVGSTFPLVYGAGALGAVAARWWAAQWNLNVRSAAFPARLPDLAHDQIAGWGLHGDVTRQVFTAVHVRHDHEDARDRRRFELVDELMREVVADTVVVSAAGEGRLAQVLDLCLVADLASLDAAARHGVDPGPVPAVADLAAAIRGGATS